MKINSTRRYVELILKALETTIVPDLKSASARGVAEMIRTILLDLQKRQGVSPEMLRRCIADGETLELEMCAQLGSKPDHAENTSGDEDFETLARRHEALTQRLSGLSVQLSGSGEQEDVVQHLLRRAAEWELSYYAQQIQLQVNAAESSTARQPRLSREFLQDVLNAQQPAGIGAVEVISFEPVPGGFGKQTFICTSRDSAGKQRELIVRKSDPVPVVMHGFCILEQEFHLLRSLAKTRFPAPQPLHLASGLAGVDASFYLTDKLPGRVPGSFLGGMQQRPSEKLFLQLAELMAQLHRIPLDTFSDYLHAHGDPAILKSNIGDCYRRNLAEWRSYAARTEHLPSPYLVWLMDWLERNIPRDSRRPVLVHGDFNIHNVLAVDDRITGVLDWECADFGAPEQDLAYIQPHISQHIDWQRFLDHYKASGGPELDQSLMPFCLAYAALRVNLGLNRGTLNLQRGTNDDIRYVMIELGFTAAFMQMALASAKAH